MFEFACEKLMAMCVPVPALFVRVQQMVINLKYDCRANINSVMLAMWFLFVGIAVLPNGVSTAPVENCCCSLCCEDALCSNNLEDIEEFLEEPTVDTPESVQETRSPGFINEMMQGLIGKIRAVVDKATRKVDEARRKVAAKKTMQEKEKDKKDTPTPAKEPPVNNPTKLAQQQQPKMDQIPMQLPYQSYFPWPPFTPPSYWIPPSYSMHNTPPYWPYPVYQSTLQQPPNLPLFGFPSVYQPSLQSPFLSHPHYAHLVQNPVYPAQ